MDDHDRDTLARFERRFAGIEAEVKDPPPFAIARGARPGVGRGPRSVAAAFAIVAVVIAVVTLGPLVRSDRSNAPASSAGVVGTRTPGPTSSPTSRPASSPAAASSFPTDAGPVLDVGTVVNGASGLDGTRLAIEGYMITHGTEGELCSGVMESYPPGCGSPTIQLVGDISASVLAELEPWCDIWDRSRCDASRMAWGDVDVVGLFHAGGDDGRMRIELEGVRAVPTVMVGDWTARCRLGVEEPDCSGASERFINLLARDGPAVFERSGGVLSVQPRPVCPPVPAYADGSFCWQVTAETALPPTFGGPWCMVITKRSTDTRYPPYVHVGGPDGTGRAGGMPEGWPSCN